VDITPVDNDHADIKHLAFIGLGNMGSGMARRLLDSGFTVTVFNRTAEKAAPLVAAGATLATSAAEAAAGKDVVLLSLSDESAVEKVLFGQLVPVLPSGSTVIDTSTVSPGYAKQAARRLAEAGLRRVEACVVGNPFQASSGELRIFAAGDRPHVDAVQGILDTLGSEVRYLGPDGMAATIKLVFNLVLGAQVAALAEAVTYGEQAGLDRGMLLSSIADSGFSSMVMKFRAGLMRERTYTPAFFRSQLMEKDLRIALDAAAGSHVALPVLESVRERFGAVVDAGDGDKDAAVLIEHVAPR
jgi:3-hydroxyisobutyrate dehydrogenase-like beta-hydroxyacid dehydrogenase